MTSRELCGGHLRGHSFRISRKDPGIDSCTCGWLGSSWADHVLGLMVDAPLEPVSVE